MGAIVPEDRPVCTAPVACFHCGLPVEAGTRFGVRVDGRWRAVCCPGCEAVAGTILGQGLEDYYRLRDTVPGRQAEQAISADLALYDDPDIQRAFVHEGQGWREATLMLEGIRCPACVWLNEKAIEAVPGVMKVDANFATQRVRVRLSLIHI